MEISGGKSGAFNGCAQCNSATQAPHQLVHNLLCSGGPLAARF
jgi:hypothetical protein